ncbi:MAG: hypothetical protein JW716_01655 [Candidatus Aenigmarchaeota archaeon]|nr:hypothetical protein [Candidatus Aenigmarchaeota archaeon]
MKTKMLYLGIPLLLSIALTGINTHISSVKKKNFEKFYSGFMDWYNVSPFNREFYPVNLNIGGKIVPGKISYCSNSEAKRATMSYSCPQRIAILDENVIATEYKVFGFEVRSQKNGKWECLGSAIDENEDNDISEKEFRSGMTMEKLLKKSKFEMKDEGTLRLDKPQKKPDLVNI